MIHFNTLADYRHYYQNVCKGDMLGLVHENGYEKPRIDWLISKCHGKILDVGCGTADFTAHIKKLGFDVEGVEPGAYHVSVAKERYPDVVVHHGFVEELPGACSFDVVLCGDVIEHVLDDVAFVRTLIALGKNVYITTPLGFWDSPEHLREYNLTNAQALADKFNGAVEVINDVNGNGRWLAFSFERQSE